MGVFERRIRVSGPTRQVWRELDAVIDTGSDHCQIPRDVLEAVGAPIDIHTTVLLPNAREIPVDIASITLQFDEYTFGTTAYVGPMGGPVLVGAYALGQMGLGVDPGGEKLIHKVLHLLRFANWPTA